MKSIRRECADLEAFDPDELQFGDAIPQTQKNSPDSHWTIVLRRRHASGKRVFLAQPLFPPLQENSSRPATVPPRHELLRTIDYSSLPVNSRRPTNRCLQVTSVHNRVSSSLLSAQEHGPACFLQLVQAQLHASCPIATAVIGRHLGKAGR
jgi:hypothetical protein